MRECTLHSFHFSSILNICIFPPGRHAWSSFLAQKRARHPDMFHQQYQQNLQVGNRVRVWMKVGKENNSSQPFSQPQDLRLKTLHHNEGYIWVKVGLIRMKGPVLRDPNPNPEPPHEAAHPMGQFRFRSTLRPFVRLRCGSVQIRIRIGAWV